MWNDNWLCLTSVCHNESSIWGCHSHKERNIHSGLKEPGYCSFCIPPVISLQCSSVQFKFTSSLFSSKFPSDNGLNRLVAVGTVYIVQVLMDAALHQKRGYHYVILQKICNKQASKEKKNNEVTCPYTNYEIRQPLSYIQRRMPMQYQIEPHEIVNIQQFLVYYNSNFM